MDGNGKVSIITVTHNNEKDIEEYLTSIFKQTYKNFEIVIVDSASSDKTLERIKLFSKVKVVSVLKNVGYGKGSNIGYKASNGDFVAILNPDTIVNENWLSELIKVLRKNPKIGIVTPKILMYANKKIINTCGNDVHFTGFGFSRGINQHECNYDSPASLFTPSGCSFIIRREILEKVGFFDEDFFLRSEVPDLAWRTHLIGYTCVYVPTSKVFHKYSFKMNCFWYYLTERGRLLLILKNYTYKSLVLLLFPLIMAEMLSWGYALLKGKDFVLAKVLAYTWLIENKHKIRKKRLLVNELRRVADREIFRMLKWEIEQLDQLVDKSWTIRITAALNSIFKLSYTLLLRMI
jgi:GT2 family glycosyltransferase